MCGIFGIISEDINKDNPYSTEKVGDFLEGLISESENNINDENLNFGQMTIIWFQVCNNLS